MVTEEEKQQAQSIGLEPEVVFNTLSDRRILAARWPQRPIQTGCYARFIRK